MHTRCLHACKHACPFSLKLTCVRAAQEGSYESDFNMLDLEYASSQILSVTKPVIVCLLLVILIVRTISEGETSSQRFAALAYDEDNHKDDSAGMRLGGALINALIFVGIITLTTTVFVLLYKYNCMKVIYGWLFTSTTMMLGFIGAFIFLRLLQVYNLPLDSISFLVIVLNFAVVGLLSIFYRTPLVLQQCYLIVASSFLGTMFFTMLPPVTTWVLLAAVAVYDIVAVLCPKGPLRILVETAQSRPNQPLPGLLYSAGMAYATITMADANHDDDDDGTPLVNILSPEEVAAAARAHPPAAAAATDELGDQHDDGTGPAPAATSPLQRESGRGLKLGLGDFIFYSVLIAHAAVTDWISVFACTVAVVIGLVMTLVCLGVYKKALPALPFSIALGICTYFMTRNAITPYSLTLSLNAVYV